MTRAEGKNHARLRPGFDDVGTRRRSGGRPKRTQRLPTFGIAPPKAPSDYPGGKAGDVPTVEFTGP